MAQQRLDTRFAATEIDKQLHRFATATLGQDLVAELAPGFRIEHALFLEARECIRRQHFGPLVAVVTGRITTGKNMAEAVLEAVEVRWKNYRHIPAHLIEC